MQLPNTDQYIGRRVTATIFDYTLAFALSIAYIFIFGEPNETGGKTVSGLPAFIPVVYWFIYFPVVEKFTGSTVGHKIFGLKIISLDSEQLRFGQIILRRVADALEIAWCFGLVAYLISKNSQHHQRLGDLMAKTLVVDKNDNLHSSQFDFEAKIVTNNTIHNV